MQLRRKEEEFYSCWDHSSQVWFVELTLDSDSLSCLVIGIWRGFSRIENKRHIFTPNRHHDENGQDRHTNRNVGFPLIDGDKVLIETNECTFCDSNIALMTKLYAADTSSGRKDNGGTSFTCFFLWVVMQMLSFDIEDQFESEKLCGWYNPLNLNEITIGEFELRHIACQKMISKNIHSACSDYGKETH